MDVETLLTNFNPADAIPALPVLQASAVRKPNSKATRDAKNRRGFAQQKATNSLANQHEVLLSQIKRGEECLDQIRRELATTQADLEEWPAYERICGANPLADYLQSIAAKEQIVKFLPGWLKRQREQLQNLNRKMAAGAGQ